MYQKVLDNEALKIFQELLTLPNPTSREDQVAARIREFVDSWGYTSEQDFAGNVLIRVKGSGKSERVVMTASHMDEIGLVVTGINKDGSLRVHKLGGMLPWKIGERPVEVLTDKGDSITGVTSFGAGHSQVGKNEITWERMRVLTGYAPDKLKELGVRVGSLAVPAMNFRGPTIFGDPEDPTIGAWIYDNRLGCAFQLSVLKKLSEEKKKPSCDWIFAFPKQEEVKGNGIKPLTIREQPDVLIAVDGGTIFSGLDIALDQGPVIKSKDKLADMNFDVILELQKAAKRAGLDPEYSVTDVAYTDASLALQAGGPMRVGNIGYTKGNSHGYEVVKYSMLIKFFKFLYEVVTGFTP